MISLILAIPVNAAGGVSGVIYKMADYYVYTGANSDGTYVNSYCFEGLGGSWFGFADDTYLGRTDDKTVSYTCGSSSTYDALRFYYYYAGAKMGTGGIEYNYIYVGDVLPNSLISFEIEYLFVMSYSSPPEGTLDGQWISMVKFYDENLNYLGILEAEELVSIPVGDSYSTLYEFNYLVEIPEGAAYIVPYQKFAVDPSGVLAGSDFTVSVQETEDLTISVNYGDIDPDSEHFEEIEGKLDDLISGSPEQNEAADNAAGELGDKREDLDDLMSGMDQLVKPDPSDLSSGLESYVDSESTLAFTDVLLTISDSGFVITMMSIACTLVLCSYVLFGKRV